MSKEKKWEEFTEENWQDYEFMIFRMQKAAEEMQKKFDLEPPLAYDSTNGVTLYDEMASGAYWITPNVDKNKLSDETIETTYELNLWPEDEEEKEEEKDVVTKVTEATSLRQLKKIARNEGEFKQLRKRVDTFGNSYDLKQGMLKELRKSKEEIKKEAEESWKAERHKKKYKVNRQKIVARALVNIFHQMDEPMTWSDMVREVVKDNEILEGGYPLDPHLVKRYVSSYCTFADEFGIIKQVEGKGYIKNF